MSSNQSWSKWKLATSGSFKESTLLDDRGAMHVLLALPEEEDPDNNHVHLKMPSGSKELVLCSTQVNGMHIHNRRTLIERVNALTGLDLKWR
jgi:hypothetical protein